MTGQHLTFETTSDVSGLTGRLRGKNLDLNIGGDIVGNVALHSGDVDLNVSDSILLGASVAITDGSLDGLIIGGKLAGTVSADAIAEELMIFNIGGNMTGTIDVIGDLALTIGGNFGTKTDAAKSDVVTVGSGTLALDVKGNIYKSAYATADDGFTSFHVGGTVDSSLQKHALLNTNPDDDPVTPGNQDTIPDHINITLPNGQIQTVSVVGSSPSVTADVTYVFDSLVTSVNISGSGTLDFSSTGLPGESLIGDMTVASGASISIGSIFVDGNLGSYTNTNSIAAVTNIEARGNIGTVVSNGFIDNIKAGGSIGELRSTSSSPTWANVSNISAGEDIEKIFALANVANVNAQGDISSISAGNYAQGITAGGRIGEILGGSGVLIVNAHDIGTINGGSIGWVHDITTTGDIDLVSGTRDVYNIKAGGKVKVVSSGPIYWISAGVGGTVQGGTVYGYTISSNIQILPGSIII